jgi:hypothetical protein
VPASPTTASRDEGVGVAAAATDGCTSAALRFAHFFARNLAAEKLRIALSFAKIILKPIEVSTLSRKHWTLVENRL